LKCPVCNSESFSWGCSVGDYSILRCRGCRLGVTDPFPTKEERDRINVEDYSVERRIDVYMSRRAYFERRYRGYAATLKKYGGRGRLLDIGCNIGLFLKVAREAGFDSAGVELNSGCAEYGRKEFGLNIYSDRLENLRFPAGSFDVITLFDTLEHIPCLQSFLSEISRIMADGGLLAVQSPNIDSLMSNLAKSSWAWLSPPDHLYHFTPGVMSMLIESKGFRILEAKTWEPLLDFCTGLFPGNRPESRAGKILLKSVKGTLYAFLGITHANRLWWSARKGGLILVYARKTGTPGLQSLPG